MPKEQQKRRGRPVNPYLGREKWWKPGATRDWFGDDADLAKAIAPASIPRSDIRWWAYGLIMMFEVPVLRRVIEKILVFDHGFNPQAVTSALNHLLAEEYIGGKHIVQTAFRIGKQTNHVYSFKRKPTQAELQYLRAACLERDRILSIHVLRDAGEQYFRAVLKASGKYASITQESRLGKVVDRAGKHALDMAATEKATRRRYGISVKNQHAWLFPGDRAIRDCYTKAKAHGLTPWLVVPFASAEAVARCQNDGIRLTVMGRQIVPAEDKQGRPMRTVIDDLRSVIGPQPFEYLYARGARTFEQSGDALEDAYFA